MKKITLRAPVTIATIVSLLVLGAALAVLARGIRNQSDAWQWVVHTREVLEHVQATIALTSEAEAAQRGFLLTGSDTFEAGYRQARDAVLPQVAQLRTLTRDNPGQQRALQPFEEALRMRLDLLDRVVHEKRAGQAPSMATLESGRMLKQRILAQAQLIRSEEQRLLQERQLRVEAGRRELITAFATTAGVAVFLVILLWVISSRDAARLLAERARLDATLRSIGDGVIATDPDGTVGLMNPVAEELTGTPEPRGVGMPLDQVLRLRERSSGRPMAPEEAMGDGADQAVLASGDGHEYAIELSAAPIHPQGAEAMGTVMVLRDVTERNARARALAESEANYRYTIELNPQMPWKAAADGRMEYLSDRWLALTGQARDAFTGSGWVEVIHAEDRPGVARVWADSVASGAPYDVEHRVHTADGQVRWVRARANPRRDDTGAIVAWYGLTEDIHARKESELALNRRLAQIETIYRAVPVGLGLVDADLRLAELNDALAEVSGTPKHAMVGMRPMDVLPAPLNGQVGGVLEQVVQTCRQVADVEFSMPASGAAQQRDWLASFYPVVDGNHLQGIVVALLEVTQIKTAQRKLIEANQLLEQRVEERTAQIAEANAELRAFAHTIAHDLRAPLRNVEGFATALLEDEAERMSEDGKLFVGRIVAAVVRMDRLITDLLAYSRLSRAELRLERVDLGTVVKTVLRDLEAQIAESSAQLDIAWPLPAVQGNATILVQVIANLVSNAIKFVDKGVGPHITISGSRDGPVARLLIGDNGIGIAPEHREHVFGVFERLHGHERYPGTGIGLAIVKKGLERMDGTVRILDRECGGSTFELTMQAAD
ncbi:PAS domain-containing protein [Massilia sp. BSC265]|uniref:PAS domain-containing protein n=1 Tax=Massilia sp. BSC265 TaxID=1549812 RepID=UPI0006901D04|nr:PAS domain-containing protein [Massilia sp. BSC265]